MTGSSSPAGLAGRAVSVVGGRLDVVRVDRRADRQACRRRARSVGPVVEVRRGHPGRARHRGRRSGEVDRPPVAGILAVIGELLTVRGGPETDPAELTVTLTPAATLAVGTHTRRRVRRRTHPGRDPRGDTHTRQPASPSPSPRQRPSTSASGRTEHHEYTWNIGDQAVVATPVALNPRSGPGHRGVVHVHQARRHRGSRDTMTDDTGTWWCLSPVFDMAGPWTWHVAATGANAADTGEFSCSPDLAPPLHPRPPMRPRSAPRPTSVAGGGRCVFGACASVCPLARTGPLRRTVEPCRGLESGT